MRLRTESCCLLPVEAQSAGELALSAIRAVETDLARPVEVVTAQVGAPAATATAVTREARARSLGLLGRASIDPAAQPLESSPARDEQVGRLVGIVRSHEQPVVRRHTRLRQRTLKELHGDAVQEPAFRPDNAVVVEERALAVAVSEMRPSVDAKSASSNPLRRASRE